MSNAHTDTIANFAALVRSRGTGRTWRIDLQVGAAEIYVCPQPHDYECSVSLSGVPMALAQDIDTGLWRKLECAIAAILNVRWEP